MPANIDGGEFLRQQELQESIKDDYSFIGLSDQSESEIKWVQLHQMFDR